jgi:non-ribosomal peptide synthase protein (TIGR01720 family)
VAELHETDRRLRQVPDNGRGYGILRYLAGGGLDGSDGDRVDVCFNYLGQFDGEPAAGQLLAVAGDVSSAPVAPANSLGHALEIVSSVTGGRLRTRWVFDPAATDGPVVAALGEAYQQALRELAGPAEER